MYDFSSEIIFGHLLQTFGNFFLVTLASNKTCEHLGRFFASNEDILQCTNGIAKYHASHSTPNVGEGSYLSMSSTTMVRILLELNLIDKQSFSQLLSMISCLGGIFTINFSAKSSLSFSQIRISKIVQHEQNPLPLVFFQHKLFSGIFFPENLYEEQQQQEATTTTKKNIIINNNFSQHVTTISFSVVYNLIVACPKHAIT